MSNINRSDSIQSKQKYFLFWYILGYLWGINFAQRAVMVAEKNQIVCTEHFATGFMASYKKRSKDFQKFPSVNEVKGVKYQFYNCYRKGKFGIPLKLKENIKNDN